MTDFDAVAARVNMVTRQLRPNRVRDERILDAMGALPREAFLPAARRGEAYSDDSVDLARGRAMLSPMVLARLLQEAGIGRGDHVLDVGCLTGYSAAVLSRLAGSVIATESDEAFAAEAHDASSHYGPAPVTLVTVADLAEGCPDHAPYDVILCEGAIDIVPEALSSQLRPGGRLLAIVRRSASLGQATLFERNGDSFGGRPLFEATMPVLPGGFIRAPSFVFA